MIVSWEFFLDDEGYLCIEEHNEGWEFAPNKPIGRPKKRVVQPMSKPSKLPSIMDIVSEMIQIDRLRMETDKGMEEINIHARAKDYVEKPK